MVFQLKIGLFSAYLSVVIVVSQNSVSRPKCIFLNPRPIGLQQIDRVTWNLRFELKLLLFSHQSNVRLHC